MLDKKQMQEIQDLKLRGYTKGEIAAYYEGQGIRPPARPTISKYYNMDVVPVDPGAKLRKDKAFDLEPFKSAIIAIITVAANEGCHISSVYDVLMEKFVENGDYEALPGNEQTLRNYVRHLDESGQASREAKNRRIYDYVPDTPPGEQMLIDFGEVGLGRNNAIHFICLLLRYSRMLLVYAQDHKYNANEACTAIYRAFSKFGGRPAQLVIDQDAVFIASETYGEVIETKVFGDFCAEQELKLWVCNKADPESKGPVENAVGFVKKNFFSARVINCIDDVWRSLPGWLERKNRRIHRTTLMIPETVFARTEKVALRPPVPSVYENSPNSFKVYGVASLPYVLYKSNKYSVPREYSFTDVLYKVAAGRIHIYDTGRNLICSHDLNECRGNVNKLPEHGVRGNDSVADLIERMRMRWNCYDFQHFVNGVKKENPRHIYKQLSAIEQFLLAENPGRGLIAAVLKECCEKYRYQFSQFKTVFLLAKARQGASAGITANAGAFKPESLDTDVEYKNLDVYQQAFNMRVRESEVAG
jgi:hypothetical protein